MKTGRLMLHDRVLHEFEVGNPTDLILRLTRAYRRVTKRNSNGDPDLLKDVRAFLKRRRIKEWET